jgi:hypothetical protein
MQLCTGGAPLLALACDPGREPRAGLEFAAIRERQYVAEPFRVPALLPSLRGFALALSHCVTRSL